MIKRRVVVLLTLMDGVLFRTKVFRPDYRYTSNFVGTLEVDEVCIVDVGTDREAFLEASRRYTDKCFSPVTIGGHVRSMDDARTLFREAGADKILVQSRHMNLIADMAQKWGSQAVVSGVDYSKDDDPVATCKQAEEAGAGEILLTSIDRDGSLQGYDLETLKKLNLKIPVVVSGGCGGWFHMKQAFECGASGAATSVIHHFTDTSLSGFKKSLVNSGVEVRP